MKQVSRCGEKHPWMDFPLYFDFFKRSEEIDRILPVICTAPMDRHGPYHRGLGPFLQIVTWE